MRQMPPDKGQEEIVPYRAIKMARAAETSPVHPITLSQALDNSDPIFASLPYCPNLPRSTAQQNDRARGIKGVVVNFNTLISQSRF